MRIITVQPVDGGRDFTFSVRGTHLEGRYYPAGSMIDLTGLVSFTADSNDLEYHFENLYSPVDSSLPYNAL